MNEKWGGAERRSWRCPGETAIAAYAQSRLAKRDQDRLEAHLSACGFCLSHVAFLVRAQDIRAIDPVPEWLLRRAYPMGTESTRRHAAASMRWAVVGSVAVALAGTFWFYGPIETEGIPEGRPPAETARTVRGESEAPLDFLQPREGAVVPADDVEFRWATAESALFYEISLVTADGDVVWQSRTEETEAQLPQEIRLTANERYYAWIRAQLTDSASIKSKTIAFEVSDRP